MTLDVKYIFNFGYHRDTLCAPADGRTAGTKAITALWVCIESGAQRFGIHNLSTAVPPICQCPFVPAGNIVLPKYD